MASQTQAGVKVWGPSTATLGGLAAGHILEAKLSIPSANVYGKTGRYGEGSVAAFYGQQDPILEITIAQDDLPVYAKGINGLLLSTSGANESVGVGKTVGARITPIEVVITPEASEISSNRVLSAWLCVPEGAPEFLMKNEQQALKITYRLLIDESKTEGEKYFRFGTTAVAADTTAPTVSSLATNGAVSLSGDPTGILVTAAMEITFNEALDEGTVVGENGKANAFIITQTETGIPVPVAAVVTYVAATFKVVITPSSSLSASTAYSIMLTSGIKNGSGLRFAGAKYGFTTA